MSFVFDRSAANAVRRLNFTVRRCFMLHIAAESSVP